MDTGKPDYVVRIERAVEALKAGGMVILCDDPDRENEGDVVIAAQHCTAGHINFMKKYARGLICVPLLPERLEMLQLPLMADRNTSQHGTAFTISVDAARDISTGISAADMAETVRILADPQAGPDDLARPGHIFPLRYAPGGVLKRHGQTEGSIDLCRIAGLYPGAVICEVCNDDGTMARQRDLHDFSERHGLPIVHVSDLVRYRLANDSLIGFVDEALLPTEFGDFTIRGYEVPLTGEHHIALVMGDISDGQPVLCRVHSECLTGDTFHSQRCDCGKQLEYAMGEIAAAGRGVLLYLRPDGRGLGLLNKIRAYHLQDGGLDTVEANLALGLPADKRDYGVGAQILRDLGVHELKLMTNNPQKLVGLEAYGLRITERIPIPLDHDHSPHVERYMKTKVEKMGHLLDSEKFQAVDEASGTEKSPADDPAHPKASREQTSMHQIGE
jgi:3,4-dihydroxy 2-butanone 4-phosphate synthase/GTP cyclohydrolase II